MSYTVSTHARQANESEVEYPSWLAESFERLGSTKFEHDSALEPGDGTFQDIDDSFSDWLANVTEPDREVEIPTAKSPLLGFESGNYSISYRDEIEDIASTYIETQNAGVSTRCSLGLVALALAVMLSLSSVGKLLRDYWAQRSNDVENPTFRMLSIVENLGRRPDGQSSSDEAYQEERSRGDDAHRPEAVLAENEEWDLGADYPQTLTVACSHSLPSNISEGHNLPHSALTKATGDGLRAAVRSRAVSPMSWAPMVYGSSDSQREAEGIVRRCDVFETQPSRRSDDGSAEETEQIASEPSDLHVLATSADLCSVPLSLLVGGVCDGMSQPWLCIPQEAGITFQA